MPTKSNDAGRALEYAVVQALTLKLNVAGIKTDVTLRAREANTRDMHHLHSLMNEQQQDFQNCANILINWVDKQGWFANAAKVEIDRLPDTEGRVSNVTDIALTIVDKVGEITRRNLSLKHNHDALKHPRLSNLPDHLKITDEQTNKEYADKHASIWQAFAKDAQVLRPGATTFGQVKAVDENFIDERLYQPLNQLVISLIGQATKDGISSFFQFVTANRDFYGIKNETGQVVVKHFTGIPLPANAKIVYPFDGLLTTFVMTFDNGWEIKFRLHSASTKFMQNGKINSSVKYDVSCLNLSDVIKTEQIAK